MRPRWPRLASFGLVRSGQEWQNPLIRLHFDCIWLHSYRLRGRWRCARTLILTFSQGGEGTCQRGFAVASFGLVRSGQEWRSL